MSGDSTEVSAEREWLGRLVAIIAFQLVTVLVAWNSVAHWGNPNAHLQLDVRWPPSGPLDIRSCFASWDGAYYFRLATQGYLAGSESCAFFPLWPLLVGRLETLGAPLFWAGLIAANLFAGLGLLGFWVHCRRSLSRVASDLALACLALFPGSIFLHVPYSEGLFLCLLMALRNALDQKRYFPAVISAFLLPLCRGVGVFLVLPLAFHGWQMACTTTSCGRWPQRAVTRMRSMIRHNFALLAAPLLGYGVYLLFMWLATGNPFEGTKAQGYWRRHSFGNLLNVWSFLGDLLIPYTIHGFEGSLVDRLIFLAMVACLPSLWRTHRESVAWVIALGVMPAMSGHLTSFLRFSASVFPVFWLAGRWLGDCPSLRLRAALLGSLTCLHAWAFWRFLTCAWVG